MGKIEAFPTERLILRELTIDDFHSIHIIKSNAAVVKYLTWGPTTKEETRNSLLKQIGFQQEQQRKIYVLAVEIKQTHEVIGNALMIIRDENYTTAEIGYFLRPDHWNKGYGQEVVQCLLSLGFLDLNLHRIYAICDVENEGSIKVLKSCGFRLEAHFKKDLHVKGEWRDNFLFAKLKTENAVVDI